MDNINPFKTIWIYYRGRFVYFFIKKIISKIVLGMLFFILLFMVSPFWSKAQESIVLFVPYVKLEYEFTVPYNSYEVILNFNARIDSQETSGGDYILAISLWKAESQYPLTGDYLLNNAALVLNNWNTINKYQTYKNTVSVFYLLSSPDFTANTRPTAGQYYVRSGFPYNFKFRLSDLLQVGDYAKISFLNWDGAFGIGEGQKKIIMNEIKLSFFNRNGELIHQYLIESMDN